MITLSSSFSPPFSVALVAVINKATAKSALTSGSTRLEFVREVPLPIKPTITRVLVLVSILGVLVSVCTHREGAQVSAMIVVVVKAISKVISCVIPIVANLSVRVKLLKHLDDIVHLPLVLVQAVLHPVRVVEGDRQRADVGRPGRHLVAISSHTQHGNGGRSGGAWAGWVARCREAWRGAR